MCRSVHQGGRRCSGCGYSAKENGNRRSNRVARRKLTEYLIANGMPEAAKAVLHAPPSIVPVIMANLDLDTADVLGTTPTPSVHAMSDAIKAQAAEITALAQAEKDGTNATLSVADLKAAVAEAEAKVDAAIKHEDDLRKASNRATVKRRKLKNEYAALKANALGEASSEDVSKALAAYQQAVADENAAAAAYKEAQSATQLAKDSVAGEVYYLTRDNLGPGEDYDSYCARLSPQDIASIKATAAARSADQVDEAIGYSSTPRILESERDTSVYTPGEVRIKDDDGETTMQGRLLDGGVAIVRVDYGEFAVLVDPRGDGLYEKVDVAGSKDQALLKAGRITPFQQVGNVEVADNPTAAEAAQLKQKALVEAISHQCAYNDTSGARQKLTDRLASMTDELKNGYGNAEVADINDGRRRHNERVRHNRADEMGTLARAEVLGGGGSKSEADAAYAKAYKKAMGTPTQGGGVIPHFDHKIPPETIGENQWTKLSHSGIRSYGTETANDYSVIHDRGGDLKKWGFQTHSSAPSKAHQVSLSNLHTVETQNAHFVNTILSQDERDAFTTYTGSGYTSINGVITGRTEQASPGVKGCVGHLRTAFEKHAEYTPADEPMTLMRGTRVPSGWSGTPSEYLDSVFSVGEKVQIGKVTSCTTKHSIAENFTGTPPYMMVIQTRRGIPVKTLSQVKSEDEVIIPMGHDLRCVRIDKKGINGVPTVYLVAEDLVAEAQDFGSAGSHKGAATAA